jgi:hypothetical protein
MAHVTQPSVPQLFSSPSCITLKNRQSLFTPCHTKTNLKALISNNYPTQSLPIDPILVETTIQESSIAVKGLRIWRKPTKGSTRKLQRTNNKKNNLEIKLKRKSSESKATMMKKERA